jgi:hypothetical protein
MSLRDANFPTSLINTTDFLIERATSRGSYGDEGPLAVIFSELSGIVERQSSLLRTTSNETITVVAEVWLQGVIAVQEHDFASWTDDHGTVLRNEVVQIDRLSHPGLTHTHMRIGRRT